MVPNGFTEAQIGSLAAIMPPLTLVFMLRTMSRTARTLITTYLGSDAAKRVLAGNIVYVINCRIHHFTANGINMASSTSGAKLIVKDSFIHNNGTLNSVPLRLSSLPPTRSLAPFIICSKTRHAWP